MGMNGHPALQIEPEVMGVLSAQIIIRKSLFKPIHLTISLNFRQKVSNMGPDFHFAAIRPHKAELAVYTAATN